MTRIAIPWSTVEFAADVELVLVPAFEKSTVPAATSAEAAAALSRTEGAGSVSFAVSVSFP